MNPSWEDREALAASRSIGLTVGRLRVLRKLSPSARGALKLARRFGDTLICVRHRGDDRGEYRYTTVELVIDKIPVQPRVERIVWLKLAPREQSKRAMIQAAGGRWDSKAGLWRLPKRVATILRLTKHIVAK